MQKPSAYGGSLHQPSIKPKGMTFKGINLIIITFLWMTQISFSIVVQEESQMRSSGLGYNSKLKIFLNYRIEFIPLLDIF